MTKPNEVAEALRLAELYQLAILDTQPEDGLRQWLIWVCLLSIAQVALFHL